MRPMFLCLIFFAFGTFSAQAQTLRITVLDESGLGVLSRIYYDEGSQPRPFWNTDAQGRLERPHNCGKTRTLKASPLDSGVYFESQEEPCSNKVTIRVLKRKTPIGLAFAVKAEPARLVDGSAGFVKFSAVMDTKVIPTGPASQWCHVEVKTIVDQEVFKVEGESWATVHRTPTPLSSIIEGKSPADTITYDLRSPCAESGGRIESIRAAASSNAAASLLGSIKAEAFRELGVRRR